MNLFSEIRTGDFANNRLGYKNNKKIVNCNYCVLTSVPGPTIGTLQHLEELRLSMNLFSEIRAGDFANNRFA